MTGKVPLHSHLLIRFQIQKSEIEMKMRLVVFFLPVLTSCWASEIETISGGVWDHYREDPVP